MPPALPLPPPPSPPAASIITSSVLLWLRSSGGAALAREGVAASNALAKRERLTAQSVALRAAGANSGPPAARVGARDDRGRVARGGCLCVCVRWQAFSPASGRPGVFVYVCAGRHSRQQAGGRAGGLTLGQSAAAAAAKQAVVLRRGPTGRRTTSGGVARGDSWRRIGRGAAARLALQAAQVRQGRQVGEAGSLSVRRCAPLRLQPSVGGGRGRRRGRQGAQPVPLRRRRRQHELQLREVRGG